MGEGLGEAWGRVGQMGRMYVGADLRVCPENGDHT